MELAGQLAQSRSLDFDSTIGPWIEPGYRLAVAMLRDPEEARDAVQEAATKAWRSLDRLRDPNQARPWFLSIVANQCRSMMRRPWWRVIRLPGLDSAGDDPQEEVVQSADIDRAMTRLSRDDRAILHLHFFLDMPLDEAARALGISTSAARSRVYRAAKRLRPELTEEEVR